MSNDKYIGASYAYYLLVRSLDGWDRLTFSLVQSRPDHLPVSNLYIRLVCIRVDRQRVLHPVGVITLRKDDIDPVRHQGQEKPYLLKILPSMSPRDSLRAAAAMIV